MPRRKQTAKRSLPAMDRLLEIIARLRAPDGCPWDREQNHRSLRYHAIEEVYELLDAIESGDDPEMEEELGDVLLQVVLHAQIAAERGAFDFDGVAQRLVDKLIHRHPHVFGDAEARTAAVVLEQWDRLKQVEKAGTRQARKSALDGIPRRLPALMRAQKLWKKASRAALPTGPEAEFHDGDGNPLKTTWLRKRMGEMLFKVAAVCQAKGLSAEDLLRQETRRRERAWRKAERQRERSSR